MLNIEIDLALRVAEISRQAGAGIMAVYATNFSIGTKNDQTPVTKADQIAEDIILDTIPKKITGEFPIVSEEAAAEGQIPAINGSPFWLIDPLDGTKEFVNRNGEFTVNIALIVEGQPVLGIVHLPAQDTTYMGLSAGAYRMKEDTSPDIIFCRKPPTEGLTALVSRSHRTSEIDCYLDHFNIAQEISAGSSLKFCRVAEGAADIYPRLGRTMEWDTAAGHAVLRYAGGEIQRLNGSHLDYGKPGFENPHFVAASLGVL